MQESERVQLLGRVDRALRGKAIESLLASGRALVGMDAAADVSLDVMLARSAVEKLRGGREPLPAELEALEAGLRVARPALRVSQDRLPESLTLLLSPQQRATIEAMLPGVAQIGWSGRIGFATGFLVTPWVLATNRHVAEFMTRHGETLAGGHFRAWFDRAKDRDDDVGTPIDRVLEVHPTEDLALVALRSKELAQYVLPLSRELIAGVGCSILVVGYPQFDACKPYFLEAIFENVYSVKRVAPGEVIGLDGPRLYHDCSTLNGNSGSPIIDINSGLVVGMHTSGQFAYRNTGLHFLGGAAVQDGTRHPRVVEFLLS